jgi:hypothetical protein
VTPAVQGNQACSCKVSCMQLPCCPHFAHSSSRPGTMRDRGGSPCHCLLICTDSDADVAAGERRARPGQAQHWRIFSRPHSLLSLLPLKPAGMAGRRLGAALAALTLALACLPGWCSAQPFACAPAVPTAGSYCSGRLARRGNLRSTPAVILARPPSPCLQQLRARHGRVHVSCRAVASCTSTA